MTVSPTNKRNRYHIELTDGVDTLGLILCNAQGDADERAYSRDALPGSAIKMFSGEQEYGDEAPPFSQTAQKNWGGGRGWKDADSDKTRYYDDHRMNTTIDGEASVWGLECWNKGLVIQSTVGYGWGVYDIYNNWFPAYAGEALIGSILYLGQIMYSTPAATYTRLHTYLKKVGSPGSLTVYITPLDAYNQPDIANVLRTITIAASEIEYGYCWNLFEKTFTALALGADDYCLVFKGAATDDADNHWEILTSTTPDVMVMYQSDDGSTWE